MHKAEGLIWLRMANMERVLKGDKPVLLACLLQDEGFEEQVRILKKAARILVGDLCICCIKDDLMALFKERYGFEGTPTFLVLYQGNSIGRLLGKTSVPELVDFARLTLATLAVISPKKELGHETIS